eukprot:TRINITY_DN5358_c0_g1_i2.p1 TRINITY_DN5358_c0_g1~~TRINITY_DN5358_c0_g1_i2.p1  ORF type:complete len:284 (+),score=73.30 TRINITY_DN5358_c0_g1_i2:82-933(+)
MESTKFNIWSRLGIYYLACFCNFSAKAEYDEFEWFRCDACSATFFKINTTLIEKFGKRTNIPGYDFVEVIEEVCATMFTKHEFGVKQHEGKKYLFGPGITDHIPDKGFGQMGMGDYDKRLAAYCRMFIEDVGEDKLREIYTKDRELRHVELCKEECLSSASGSGAYDREKKPKKKASAEKPPPPSPPEKPKKKEKAAKKDKVPSQDDSRSKTTTTAAPTVQEDQPEVLTSTEALEKAKSYLPQLNPMQLKYLGEAVLEEMVKQAAQAAAAAQDTRLRHSRGEL